MSMASPSSGAPAGSGGRGGGVLTWPGLRQGLRRMLPVGLFVLPFGIAFGAAAVDAGMTTLQAVVMSALVFAGASQFAALDLWHTPLPYLSLALVVLAVNARHIILGAALSPWVNSLSRSKRLLALGFMSDANFADSYAAFRKGGRDVGLLLGGGLMLWSIWIVGTALGAVAGAEIGALDRFGIDVVMAAFFAAIVVGELKTRASLLPVAIASAVTVLTLDLLPVGWNIIAAALCGGLAGALLRAR